MHRKGYQEPNMSGFFIMDVAYMRFSTDDRPFFIAVVSVMSDSTLINGEGMDPHGPKGLSIAEHVWMFHNGRSVYAVLYW